jgi:serine/threonine protein kinase
LSFFKGNTSYSKILSELRNVRTFTKEEINEVTHNYSYLLSGGTSSATEVYKGTLEDNTMVAVHKLIYEDSEEAFINGGMVVSKIAHKNIVKILGCCLESQTIAFLYEYIAKGSISDILGSQEDFPLDLRMRIAIKTAEALQYLHSSETGIIGHGSVSASTILLDNNFLPKLTEFSRACMLFKKSETAAGVITSSLLEKALNNDPSRYGSVLMNLESDVYKFGGVLMALISRDKDTDHEDLLTKFTKAYETEKTGKELFDKDITAEEDIILLEELGRLALKCTILNADKISMRPTMKEVADELQTIRRSWKERGNEAAAQVTEATTDVVPAEPRLPNLMRHMFGYRRISTSDPIHVY